MASKKEDIGREMTEKDDACIEKPSSKVPPREARPSEVRAYLTRLLIDEHDATPELAQETAERWKLGRGWDLRDMSEKRCRAILGDDVGPFLFRTVRKDIQDEWDARKKVVWDRWRTQGYPRMHLYTAIASIVPAAAIVHLYGRVVTAIYVACLVQIPISLKLSDDLCVPVIMICVFLGFFVAIAIGEGL